MNIMDQAGANINGIVFRGEDRIMSSDFFKQLLDFQIRGAGFHYSVAGMPVISHYRW